MLRRNPNLEIRNKGPMIRLGHSGLGFWVCFEFRNSDFDFNSSHDSFETFEFRISDLF